MPTVWLALMATALAPPTASGFQVVAWSRTGDEALIAKPQGRSITPSLCFLNASTGESSGWLSPLVGGTLAAGAPAINCEDTLAAVNGELVGAGFELAVNPDFCDSSEAPLFSNLDTLTEGADADRPFDAKSESGLFEQSYSLSVISAGDDLIRSPAHPRPEELGTLRTHRSATEPHGLLIVGGADGPHVVDLFYSWSGRFDDSRRESLSVGKLALHPPMAPVALAPRVALAVVGVFLMLFAGLLQVQRASPWHRG